MRDYEDDEDEPYVVIERSSGSVGSFILGLALGAGVALLMAPRSGLATRRELRRRARRVGKAAKGVAETITDSVTDTFTEARAQVEERIDSARRAVELRKEQVTRAVAAGRAAAQQARDDLERRIAETKAVYDASAPAAGRRGGGAAQPRAGSPGD